MNLLEIRRVLLLRLRGGPPPFFSEVPLFGSLTPLQLETRFGGQITWI